MLNLEQVLTQRFPSFFGSQPRILTKPMLTLLRMLFHEREVNRFLEENHGVRGLDFIEKVLEYFDLDYLVSNRDLENIPPTGRVGDRSQPPAGRTGCPEPDSDDQPGTIRYSGCG
ncbi:MAG: hypothetical protein KZQ65_10620 [Candidatus Thiodiazotropha sp. (ex Gloverina cf. vestifex)]|nr:hypothetical protein [Candidatus Thiodiazotropha sp. (ex Gloverina cf. vestifex)]